MVRKAPATTKHKGSQKNEAYTAGITGSSDFVQQHNDPAGLRLDKSVAENAAERTITENGEDERYMGRTNVPDYIVPAGVQLTENLIEEIVEGSQKKTPEHPAEK